MRHGAGKLIKDAVLGTIQFGSMNPLAHDSALSAIMSRFSHAQ